MTDVPATVDDLLGDLFETQARDWPYSGPRNVTLAGVTVEVSDRFFNVYTDENKKADFEEQRQYKDPNELPTGYTAAPQINLVLNMEVDDAAIPEPEYPPVVPLGDTNTVEIHPDGTQFRFIKTGDSAGEPRKINARSTLAHYIAALVRIHPDALKGQLAKIVGNEDHWFPTSFFDGLALTYDGVAVEINGYSKQRAWPVGGPAETATASTPAPSGASVAEIAAAAESADDFRNKVLAAQLGDADLIAAVVADPAGEWEKAKA